MAKRKTTPPKLDPTEERFLAIEDRLSAIDTKLVEIDQKQETTKESSHIQWLAPVVVVAILAALIFFVWPKGGESNPTPKPDPFSIIEGEKVKPTPVAEKKLQGTLLLIHNLDPMTEQVAKMVEHADEYREKVGKSVFDYLSLDEKSQNPKVLQLINAASEQNIRPPFIVFKQAGETTHKYASRPATFSEIVNTYGR